MFKRSYALLALLVIAGMALAACGPAASAFECTDTLGCVDIASGEPIHIAYAMVISGPDSTLGIDSRTGAEVAIALKGQVLGHDVQLTGEDDGCSAEGGQAAGTKLAADPSIIAVIGTSCSSAARVAVPLLSQAGFVIISASNTAPDLTRAGDPNQHPGYMRTAHNDEIQGAAAARFAFEKMGVKKAATIHDGSLYAQSLKRSLPTPSRNWAVRSPLRKLSTRMPPTSSRY